MSLYKKLKNHNKKITSNKTRYVEVKNKLGDLEKKLNWYQQKDWQNVGQIIIVFLMVQNIIFRCIKKYLHQSVNKLVILVTPIQFIYGNPKKCQKKV